MKITIIPNDEIVPRIDFENVYQAIKKQGVMLADSIPEIEEIIVDFEYIYLNSDFLMTHLVFENNATLVKLTITSSQAISSEDACYLISGKLKTETPVKKNPSTKSRQYDA